MARQPWWRRTLPEQMLTVEHIKSKISGYTGPLGLSPADVTAIQDICDAILGAQDFRVSTEATGQAVTEWRDLVFFGEPKGDAVSPAPVFEVKGAVTYTRGSVTQLFDWRDNILTRPGYTEAIGEDLKLVGAESEPADPGTIQPTLKVEAAMQGGFAFGATIGNRGEADQWVLSAAPVGTTDWQQIDIFTGKTGNGTWPDGQGQPVQLQFRAQLRLKNANYGVPSDIVTVTVIP